MAKAISAIASLKVVWPWPWWPYLWRHPCSSKTLGRIQAHDTKLIDQFMENTQRILTFNLDERHSNWSKRLRPFICHMPFPISGQLVLSFYLSPLSGFEISGSRVSGFWGNGFRPHSHGRCPWTLLGDSPDPMCPLYLQTLLTPRLTIMHMSLLTAVMSVTRLALSAPVHRMSTLSG